MTDKRPRFQSTKNNYWTESALVYTYPVLGVEFEALHTACVEMARHRPYNSDLFRINPMLGGCLPFTFDKSGSPNVGPSTCVALTLRLIAQARTGNDRMLMEDKRVIWALKLPREGCSPTRLVGYTPERAVNALRESKILGTGRRGFRLRDTHAPSLLLLSR